LTQKALSSVVKMLKLIVITLTNTPQQNTILKKLFLLTFFLFSVFFVIQVAKAAAPIISDIASSTVTNQAAITWTTNEAASSTVYYGLTSAYGLASSSDDLVTSHSVVIKNLVASTTYYFKVSSANGSGEISSSSEQNFRTAVNFLGLYAEAVRWLDATHIRATYNWSNANQLLDWTPTPGTSLVRGSSTLSIVDGTADIFAMTWIKDLKVSRVSVRENPLDGGYLNLSTGINSAWRGNTWNPNPGLGNIWYGGGGVWTFDGANESYAGPEPDNNTWNDFEFQVSSTSLRAWSDLNDTWYERTGTYDHNSGLVSLGGHNSDTEWGLVEIEGEIIPDTDSPVISLIASSTSPTTALITWITDEFATSSIEYGETVSYGMSSSSNSFIKNHSIFIDGLTTDTLYHFRVSSRDSSGNASTSADYTFTPTYDIVAPNIFLIKSFTTPTSTTISWSTDELATSTLLYGLTGDYGSSSTSIYSTTSGSVVLTTLAASSSYHFKILARDKVGNTGSSTDQVFISAYNNLGLNAYLVGWLDSTHIRAVYDWSDADQLLDWTPTTGVTFNLETSTVRTSGGSTNVRSMKWNQPIAVSRITVKHNPLSGGYLNLLTNLDPSWVGATWTPNPNLGHIWYSSGAVWTYNGGSTYDYNAPIPVNNTWHNFEFQASSNLLRAWDDIDPSFGWQELSGSYAPSTSGIVALGAYTQQIRVDDIMIEGEVEPDISEPVISSIVSSTVSSAATISWTTNEISTSSVAYGLTSSYGSTTASDLFVTAHSIVVNNLQPLTVYHFKISSTDAWVILLVQLITLLRQTSF
jgi:hypothetical protein